MVPIVEHVHGALQLALAIGFWTRVVMFVPHRRQGLSNFNIGPAIDLIIHVMQVAPCLIES